MPTPNDHDIELIGPGELQWCRRCQGGEVELQESCAVRLAREVEMLRARIGRGQEREQDYAARLEGLTVARDAPSEPSRAAWIAAVDAATPSLQNEVQGNIETAIDFALHAAYTVDRAGPAAPSEAGKVEPL